ncbi:MAG: hypothetical protein V1742_02215 [Pseudomonadota bacterium]
MTIEFVHDLAGEVRSVAGAYELEQDGLLEINGRQVLYLLGHAVVDSACCGTGGCRYALVPGYVHKLKARQNEHGAWVSEVEPVTEEKARREISRHLEKKELVQQVQFL